MPLAPALAAVLASQPFYNADVFEVLQKARALIVDPTSWMRGGPPIDKNGMPVSIHSGRVRCRCTMAAIHEACGIGGEEMATRCMDAMARAILDGEPFDDLFANEDVVVDWNDAADHATVLRGFDRAMALCETPDL